jgi:hypothetical protein
VLNATAFVQKRVAMKYELYKKEQEAMQKQLAEATAESLQKQRTRKEAQFLKLEQEVEVRRVDQASPLVQLESV